MHMDQSGKKKLFAQVILPIAIEKEYTYEVPFELADHIQFGMRVEVQFGTKKRYSGIVADLTESEPEYQTRQILDIVDDQPVITQQQYRLWQWMSDYYCCTIGEVMHAALPSGLQLTSESIFLIHQEDEDILEDLEDEEYMVYMALKNKGELRTAEVQQILDKKSIYPVIHQLFRKGVIIVKEELQEKYTPKIVHYAHLASYFVEDRDRLTEAFDLVSKSSHQTNILLAFIKNSPQLKALERGLLLKEADAPSQALKAMENKGIFEVISKEINRFEPDDLSDQLPEVELSPAQSKAMVKIRRSWDQGKTCLLHGVTSSGKTLIYTQLIREMIEEGKQALYLLPEIALSVQIISRLRKDFGDQVVVSHSRLNNNERVDLWKRVQEGVPVVLGVRSSIFLPFQDLGLIIVDEEHDASFKQADPNPRYQARDVAVYMGTQWNCHMLLGSATPSMESYYNAQTGKYGIVSLLERFQAIEMPEIELVDLRYAEGHADRQLSNVLVDDIRKTLARKLQVIIFKNRRGYAPTLRCTTCSWHAQCKNCDISLTFHKYRNNLHCHLCGYRTYLPHKCPACGSDQLVLEGYGTQKIEDELEVLFPDTEVERMDFDTTRRRKGYEKLIEAFEEQKIDILVGTQMVTKGLDFDHVGLVGVVHGDQQLFFPDFRAAERTFQLLVQVSGRAGRKNQQGKVVIQTFHPDHPVFSDIKRADFESFYQREVQERKRFQYPPFYRLIKLTVSHTKQDTARFAAHELSKWLKGKLGSRVIGPAEPQVSRVRGKYLFDIGIKLEKDPGMIRQSKMYLLAQIARMQKLKGMSNVRVRVDVDP